MTLNHGTVTNLSSALDIERLSRYCQGKTALVAQGGGQRGIFTAGVLDAFMMSDFDPFDEFYGTSAGAVNLCAYLCRQHTLGRRFLVDVTTNDEFFSLFGFLKRHRYLNLEWGFEQLTHFPMKLDLDLGRQVLGDRKAFAAVTCSNTLKDRYLPMLGPDWMSVLVATCAIPYLYRDSVPIGEHYYYDGGISAAIPVQQAWRNNARLIITVRTEEEDTPLRDTLPSQAEFERKHQSDSGWAHQLDKWKASWSDFLEEKLEQAHRERQKQHHHLPLLNGGRWLFGAQDIYRLSHVFGDNFDSGLADMLLVHYQTYSLTQDFLNNPPDDCFVVQIKPHEPLLSTALMSTKEDLIHDYQLGLDAGYRFITDFLSAKNLVDSTSARYG
ncbi:patatin family protein [Vibrio astriarenae]|uniref:Patatin family protein n=1 Tax=Vibrio astriarenae TaxID=1481923 RepID=A0A7Z2T2A0_9VIBR|nr:patatin-like phospholipase family protein [Vibrio astriarenae]QIA62935.1 patatin family protein [Vibrio astriarenae]